jgi:hypothetical protein
LIFFSNYTHYVIENKAKGQQNPVAKPEVLPQAVDRGGLAEKSNAADVQTCARV